jgi:hypothetical protein
MALVELKTNLKNLKFGNDQPGYGSSGLPFIQVGIPKDPLIIRSPTVQGLRGEFLPIYRPGSTGAFDYPIRGGGGDFNVGLETYTISNQVDRIRIKRFFETARGQAFIQKQIGLQLSNPKMETGNTLFGIGQAVPLPGLLENTRVYNKGLNTLAQVATMGSGAHAVRHGTIPFNPFQKNYYSIVNEQNIEGGALGSNQNRLVILTMLKMTASKNPIVDIGNTANPERINSLGISLNKNILFQYLGGPGSVYGIGNTTIKRVVDTTKINTINGQPTRINSSNSMVYETLMAQKTNLGNSVPNIQDFRLGTTGKAFKENTMLDTEKYTTYMSRPFEFDNKSNPWDVYQDDGSRTDIIKFVFEAVSNTDPTKSTAIFFRAFLTAGITDNNSATLSAFKYAGRGENFYTYQGFDRSISFSFRVAAQNDKELLFMYEKLNALVQQVYPDYSAAGVMRAPLVKVTIGDYLYRMPGFLENVNITVDNNYPWEINLQQDLQQLPQVVDVNITFKPILNTLPSRSATIIGRPNTIELYKNTIYVDPYDYLNEAEGQVLSREEIRANNKNARKTKRQEKIDERINNRQERKNERLDKRDEKKAFRNQKRNDLTIDTPLVDPRIF